MIANPSALTPVIREMRQSDLLRVAAIEREAYEFPWSGGIFRDCLLAGYTSLVTESRGEVIAYAIMSVAAAEAHLLNLCVAVAHQRSGYGRRMLYAIIERAIMAGADTLHLEVRPSNDAAIALYLQADFQRVGIRRRYYRASCGNEDAVLLSRRLDRDSGGR